MAGRTPDIGSQPRDSTGTASTALTTGSSTSSTLAGRLAARQDGLATFQLGVGLPGATGSNGKIISRSNQGTYAAIRSAEASARLSYYFYEYLLSGCVVAQIVLGASLTALGASNSDYVVIAILGAINTATAGTIAMLKGQGLPNRPRQDWNSWRAVREYVEDREREFAAGMLDASDADKEIQAVLDLYHETKVAVEKNRPDMYTGVPGITGRISLGGTGATTSGAKPASYNL